MADKKQKYSALNQAVDVAKEYGKGGYTKEPALLIQKVYDKIIKILDEIEKDND